MKEKVSSMILFGVILGIIGFISVFSPEPSYDYNWENDPIGGTIGESLLAGLEGFVAGAILGWIFGGVSSGEKVDKYKTRNMLCQKTIKLRENSEKENVQLEYEQLINKINSIGIKEKRQELLSVIKNLDINNIGESKKLINNVESYYYSYINNVTKIEKITNKRVHSKFLHEFASVKVSLVSKQEKILKQVDEYLGFECDKEKLLKLPIIKSGNDRTQKLYTISKRKDFLKYVYDNYDNLIKYDGIIANIEKYYKEYNYSKSMFAVVYVDDKIVVVEKSNGLKETYKNNGVKYEIGKYYSFK